MADSGSPSETPPGEILLQNIETPNEHLELLESDVEYFETAIQGKNLHIFGQFFFPSESIDNALQNRSPGPSFHGLSLCQMSSRVSPSPKMHLNRIQSFWVIDLNHRSSR